MCSNYLKIKFSMFFKKTSDKITFKYSNQERKTLEKNRGIH